MSFRGFFAAPTFANLLNDGAFLGVIAIGMTFVILSGGIDLSVGSLAGLAAISAASLMSRSNVSPWLSIGIALFGGAILGAIHGLLVTKFRIAPFLVTLAGLFLYRGVALAISRESITLEQPEILKLASWSFTLPASARLSIGSILFIFLLLAALLFERQTKSGRAIRAIGGGEYAATVLGLPVSRTLILTYSFSGLCAALGGLLFMLYTSSGNAVMGQGLELDAIACVVIGGVALTGGYGSIFGTLIGLLMLGTIQVAIIFQGSLSSWWSKIVVGVLILLFVVLQRLFGGKSIKQ